MLTFAMQEQNRTTIMKFLRKPNVTIAILAVYTAIIYLYFFPKNNEMTSGEKWATVGASAVILALLWLLLRKREKMRRKREEDMNNDKRSEA